jgi:uncharacterized protein YgbK (DUF1537 family)
LNEKSIEKQVIFRKYPEYDREVVKKALRTALELLDKKVVVLDDDPTGVQTVHDVNVYTDWTKESIQQGFEESNSIFFILTNSRGFTEELTRSVHKEIAENVIEVSKKLKKDFILISRGDSTLRGHYPLETKILKETIENNSNKLIDGEVILPFFVEGGRFTIDNVQYVANGDTLVPSGETEFAADKTFGYKSSHLGEWIEEKGGGEFKKEDVTYITLEELRTLDYGSVQNKLMAVNGFGKVVVNAIDYSDVEVFVTALVHALLKGKNYIFRSAAALTKVIGGVSDKELLTKDELINTENKNGGLIIVGSHVKKTTMQLENLKKADFIEFVEFNQHLVLDNEAFEAELKRVIHVTEENISRGKTVAVYTRRERFDLNTGNKEDELRIAAKISDAITSIVNSLKVRPNFIVAKGGITSSDIGTKGLHVKKALVLGQILKGIPVWLTGNESKFPNMPYVIFPGNVGDENALLDAVTIMQPYK